MPRLGFTTNPPPAQQPTTGRECTNPDLPPEEQRVPPPQTPQLLRPAPEDHLALQSNGAGDWETQRAVAA